MGGARGPAGRSAWPPRSGCSAGGGSGSNEEQWGPGSVTKPEVTGLANGLDVGDREGKKVKGEGKVFGLSNGKEGFAIY